MKGFTCLRFFFFSCREVGERPRHWPRWGGHRNATESGYSARTFLEVSYDCSPSHLRQVQSLPDTQRTAGSLRTQEHPAYTHSGRDGFLCSMLFLWTGCHRSHTHQCIFFWQFASFISTQTCFWLPFICVAFQIDFMALYMCCNLKPTFLLVWALNILFSLASQFAWRQTDCRESHGKLERVHLDLLHPFKAHSNENHF